MTVYLLRGSRRPAKGRGACGFRSRSGATGDGARLGADRRSRSRHDLRDHPAVRKRCGGDVAGGSRQREASPSDDRQGQGTRMSRTVFRMPPAARSGAGHDRADMAVPRRRCWKTIRVLSLLSTTSFTFGGQTVGTINGILSRLCGRRRHQDGFTCGSGYNLVARRSATAAAHRRVARQPHNSSAQRDGRLVDVGFTTIRQTWTQGEAANSKPPTARQTRRPAGPAVHRRVRHTG